MTDGPQPAKRKHRKKPPEKRRLSEQELNTMSEIFGCGFGDWYRQSHDENGNLLPSARIPGLTPQKEVSSNE